MKIKLFAPAKINLFLKIGARQKNNLHEIFTKIAKIDLCDEIEICAKKSNLRKIKIEISGPQKKGVPSNCENSVFRAVRKFCDAANLAADFEIKICKKIPNRAGLGGGSSNAGVVLRALFENFRERISVEKVLKIAHEIGSDIPFFFENFEIAKVENTGEKIVELPHENFFIAIATLPRIEISTKWAFEKLVAMRNLKFENSAASFGNLNSKQNFGKNNVIPENFAEIYPESRASFSQKIQKRKKETENFGNDFEEIIFSFFPDLKNLKNLFLKNGATRASLTGTGAAVFGIFENENAAKNFEKNFAKNFAFFYRGKNFDKK